MKDVKSMICQELEFSEDCPMELLVAGSIINLELPISSVFESVWRQSLVPRPGLPPPPVHECPPMSTLYRLQVETLFSPFSHRKCLLFEVV